MADRWCESYVCEMSKSIKPWELAKEEVASQSIGRNFRSPRLFVFSRAHPAERFFAFGLRGKQVVIAHPMSGRFPRQRRRPLSATLSYAVRLNERSKRWTVLNRPRGQSLPVDSLVKCCTACKLRKRRLLQVFRPVPRVRIHSAPATQSGLQRNSAEPYREMRETCPYFAIRPRQTGLQRKNCSAAKSVTVLVFLWMAHRQSGFGWALGNTKRLPTDELAKAD